MQAGHILNFSATEDQEIYDARVKMIKPIADCMRQEQQPSQQQPSQQQPSQQQQPNNNYPYQQQPNSNYPQQQPYSFPPYQQPSSSYPPPSILSQSAYTDSTGTFHIVGEVINQSPITAKFVKIIVTFYNAYNQVVGTDYAYTQPSDLAPGQRAPFDIHIFSGSIPMNQVRNHALFYYGCCLRLTGKNSMMY